VRVEDGLPKADTVLASTAGLVPAYRAPLASAEPDTAPANEGPGAIFWFTIFDRIAMVRNFCTAKDYRI